MPPRKAKPPKDRVIRIQQSAWAKLAGDIHEFMERVRKMESRLDEMAVRLESNRRATLECILGQHRAEEEIRKTRVMVDSKDIIEQMRSLVEVQRSADAPIIRRKK